MSSSESDTFESADEDFENDLHEKLNIKKRNSPEKCMVEETKDMDYERQDRMSTEILEKFSTNLANKIANTVKQKIDKNDEIPNEKIENTIIDDKLQLHQSVPDEQGWAFDEWENNDQQTDIQSDKSNTIKKSTTENIINENDGWDFDNWDDESIVMSDNNTPANKLKLLPNRENIDHLIDPSNNPNREIQFKLLTNERNHHQPSGDVNNTSNDWSVWSPWEGVVSLLSTASDSVVSLTQHVSSVIESGIGVPDPIEIAQQQQQVEQKKRLQQQQQQQQQIANNEPSTNANITIKKVEENKSEILGNLVFGVTNIGNRVLASGLDTLEGIGKKTMTILQENDPGLLKKRKLLGLDQNLINLSQILREAKEKTEETERNLKIAKKHEYKKKLHFETLFDEYHGLVHLEALEILSKQSTLKLENLLAPLSGIALDNIQDTLNEVLELCELSLDLDGDAGCGVNNSDGMHDATELHEKLQHAVEDLDIPVNFDDILRCWRESIQWIENYEKNIVTSQEIYDKALRCVAHTSALTVGKMHKLAELLLIKERHSTANEADALVQMTYTMCWHLSGIGTSFCNALNTTNDINQMEAETNSFITSIFLECSNSITYIQKAFQLFVPILQIGAV